MVSKTESKEEANIHLVMTPEGNGGLTANLSKTTDCLIELILLGSFHIISTPKTK